MEQYRITMNYLEAKKIMGKNFIGPEELNKISSKLNLANPLKIKIPKLAYSADYLKSVNKNCLLILGIAKTKDGSKFTLNQLREKIGVNPKASKPCFYNQDWYLKEKFAKEKTLTVKWYLINKSVRAETRGLELKSIKKSLSKNQALPFALLAAYVFFAYYFLNKGKKLWVNDFIWCSDKDHNGDQIYVGRYLDPKKINQNGFNIHRHLTINKTYGLSPIIL